MTGTEGPLAGRVALVAGATRGAGIAVELGATGATVYVTGRTTREHRSEYDRPEAIEDTAELATAAGGRRRIDQHITVVATAMVCCSRWPSPVRGLLDRRKRDLRCTYERQVPIPTITAATSTGTT